MTGIQLPPISQQIWDMKYRLKTLEGDPIDQTIEDTWRRVADALAKAEKPEEAMKWAAEFYRVMIDGHFSPAGRIIAGAGSERNITLSNCYTMGTIPDSMDGIFSSLREAALTMQAGGGIGYDFSTLRPKGAPVKGVGADASGPLSFMDVWDMMCRTIMSAGSRRGAMMATMRCDHPDIEDFIEAKADPNRLRMFNLSVLVTDAFMEAVKQDADWRLYFENRHGETISEKTVKARDLWEKIMRSTYAYAEPGVIFIDRVNDDHNLGYLETIATTNPCGEKPMGPYASCLLGSINLAKLVLNPYKSDAGIDALKLDHAVRVAIRMMDNVVDVGLFPLEEQYRKAHADRQLGLGVTGLADALVMMNKVYGSDETAKYTERLMERIALVAYQTSINLAKEKGAFPSFVADKFLSGQKFANRMLPEMMKAEIRKHGIRNGLLLSIAPTGTISLFAGNVSSGIEPIFAGSYTRKVLQPDGTKTEEVVRDYALSVWEDLGTAWAETESGPQWVNPPAYVDAQNLSPAAHVKMQAAAQKWVDSSISKTVNVPEDISFEAFQNVYEMAYELGCKGCTTYRPNEVTGSILSVETKPEKPEEAMNDSSDDEMSVETLMEKTRSWLEQGEKGERDDKQALLAAILSRFGLARVNQIETQEQFDAIFDLITGNYGNLDEEVEEPPAAKEPALPFLSGRGKKVNEPVAAVSPPVHPEGFAEYLKEKLSEPTDRPVARPDDLDGKTYKIKFGADDHAVYVTINDVFENGERRPFEVFINSKNMQHYAWTLALTRMISAIFRRPHDSTFVVEELKAVFDPSGGAWVNGRYVPSIIAAIGGVIEQHMIAIGYIGNEAQELAKLPEPATVRRDTRVMHTKPSVYCEKCSSSNVKFESGCFTCMDCGHSKCG